MFNLWASEGTTFAIPQSLFLKTTTNYTYRLVYPSRSQKSSFLGNAPTLIPHPNIYNDRYEC